METLNNILTNRYNVINDNKNYSINVSNDSNEIESKYSLNRRNFIPNTQESQLAEEIATYFADTKNFACYFNIVNKLGFMGADIFFREIKSDIEEKSHTKTPVRKPAAYFVWRFKREKYEKSTK